MLASFKKVRLTKIMLIEQCEQNRESYIREYEINEIKEYLDGFFGIFFAALQISLLIVLRLLTL